MAKAKATDKVVLRELKSLEKRIERAEKKIADLKSFRRQIRDFLEEHS